MRLLFPVFTITVAFAQTRTAPPAVIRNVEIVWGPELEKSYYIEARRVDLQLDAGDPVAIIAPGGIPDNVVRALSKWKFRGGDRVTLTVPVRKPLTPLLEQSFRHGWKPATQDLEDSLKQGAAMTSVEASALAAKVSQDTHDVLARSTLLAYAAAAGGEQARKLREDQLTWLVLNMSDEDILGSPLSVINAREDPDAYRRVGPLWIAQVKDHPDNVAVLEHAIQFVKMADPDTAEQLIRRIMGPEKSAYGWLGELYALQLLGVTALDPHTGLPSTAMDHLPDTPATQKIRTLLDSSTDVRATLSTMLNIGIDARALAKAGHLPQGFAGWCEQLRAQAEAVYPQTSASCDTSLTIPEYRPTASGQIGVESATQLARRTKFVSPTYPEGAKSQRIQGSVKFQAIIGPDGKIRALNLVSGGLIFYESARSAVSKWVYTPTQLNGKPVDVETEITVNYTLQ